MTAALPAPGSTKTDGRSNGHTRIQQMRHATGLGTLLVGLTVALAACGGSGAATSVPTQAPAATAAGGGAATSAPTAAPVNSVTPTQAGGGATADACSLITLAEVLTVVNTANAGTEAVTTTAWADNAGCDYFTAGPEVLVGLGYSTTDAAVYFAAAQGAGAVQVSGVGDAAGYLPDAGKLLIKKGESVADIQIHTLNKQISDWTQTQRIELLKKLGAFIANRM